MNLFLLYGRRKARHTGEADIRDLLLSEEKLIIKSKELNIAGLQLADIIAFGQKTLTVLENKRPCSRPLSTFAAQLNSVVNPTVNRYGRYLLE